MRKGAKEGTRTSGKDHGARVASERREKRQGQDAVDRSPPDHQDGRDAFFAPCGFALCLQESNFKPGRC